MLIGLNQLVHIDKVIFFTFVMLGIYWQKNLVKNTMHYNNDTLNDFPKQIKIYIFSIFKSKKNIAHRPIHLKLSFIYKEKWNITPIPH